MTFMRYRPPKLDRRVLIRDPSRAPVALRDAFGRPMAVGEYGRKVWASVRDARVVDEVGDGVETRGTQTVFTVRYRELPADFVVVHKGIEYLSIGAPVLRGGADGGMRARYVELWTERRQLAAT